MGMTFSSVDGGNGSKAVCTTGSETPTLAATDGLDLKATNVGSLIIHYEAAGVLTAGTLQAYVKNNVTAVWSRAPRLDIAVTGGANSEASEAFEVMPGAGRIAYAPSGLGQAGDLYILSQPRAF